MPDFTEDLPCSNNPTTLNIDITIGTVGLSQQ